MENEKIWQVLLDAIKQQRVVPIIGDEFYYTVKDGQRVPYMDFLIEELLKKFPLPPILKETQKEKHIAPDFNMVADTIRFNNIISSQMYGTIDQQTSIYYEIEAIVRETPVLCDEYLVDLLERNVFPLILTTSFLPGIETALQQRGKTVAVKSYDKSPRTDVGETQGTILYYMFGRCSKANKGYMVTEDDLLDYMHFWHNYESRPKELCKILSSKFILALGCGYPNWLFRFFWHSIKNFSLSTGTEGMKGVVAAAALKSDNDLARFLSRLQTHTHSDCSKLITNLSESLPADVNHEPNNGDALSASVSHDECDIFLSYSHVDRDLAVRVADTLRECGAKVWFDENQLEAGDYYDNIIKRKIEECKRFVPILSHTTLTTERAYFRKEWTLAIKEMEFRLGVPYIAPILVDDSDITDARFPQAFRDTHILDLKSDNFRESAKKLIRSFRQ